MPGETGKRKKAEQDSGDEIQPERLNKLQRIGYVTSNKILGYAIPESEFRDSEKQTLTPIPS